MPKKLRDIDGKKIRWNFFTLPVLLHYWLMLLMPYTVLWSTLGNGSFNMKDWSEFVCFSVLLLFCCSLPWAVLHVLNRFCFGITVCVLADDGIYYKDGFIAWESICEIDYVVKLPVNYHNLPRDLCHAVIYTGDETVELYHAPLCLLRSAKKIHPEIKTQLSTGSKFGIAAGVLFNTLIIPIIVLLYSLIESI